MKVIQKENYKIIREESGDITEFATYLSQHHEEIEDDNVVVDLLDFREVPTQNLLSFLEFSNLHRRKKKSFVIAVKDFSLDEIPDDLIVVPTLQEAEDIINMEDLERELGY